MKFWHKKQANDAVDFIMGTGGVILLMIIFIVGFIPGLISLFIEWIRIKMESK